VQRVAYWYGQLARLPRGEECRFKAIESVEPLKRVTLFAGAATTRRREDYWRIDPDPSFPFRLPLVH